MRASSLQISRLRLPHYHPRFFVCPVRITVVAVWDVTVVFPPSACGTVESLRWGFNTHVDFLPAGGLAGWDNISFPIPSFQIEDRIRFSQPSPRRSLSFSISLAKTSACHFAQVFVSTPFDQRSDRHFGEAVPMLLGIGSVLGQGVRRGPECWMSCGRRRRWSAWRRRTRTSASAASSTMHAYRRLRPNRQRYLDPEIQKRFSGQREIQPWLLPGE